MALPPPCLENPFEWNKRRDSKRAAREDIGIYSIIVVSDVHGATNWRKFVEMRRPGQHAVFLGDYFDHRGRGPFAASQTENFLEICDYARSSPNTTLLVGNHDYQYMPWAAPLEHHHRAGEYRAALMENIDLLQMVLVNRDFPVPVIFSHGGLTATFLRQHDLSGPDMVNAYWLDHPEMFEWIQSDPKTGMWSDLTGDDPWQSPIWARTQALVEDAVPGYDQVVGHTPTREPFVLDTKNGAHVLMTCTLDDQEIIVDTGSRF